MERGVKQREDECADYSRGILQYYQALILSTTLKVYPLSSAGHPSIVQRVSISRIPSPKFRLCIEPSPLINVNLCGRCACTSERLPWMRPRA